jgi:uncharacterized protein
MAVVQPKMPRHALEAAVVTRFAAITIVSLMIGDALAGCAQRSASSEKRDNDRLLAQLHRLASDAEAKRTDAAAARAVNAEASEANRTNRQPPLVDAAQFGDLDLVQSLLARGADRKALNEALFTTARSEPLVVDATGDGRKGQRQFDRRYAAIADLLLRKGARIKIRDEYGDTPFTAAAGNGETAVVKLLIQEGADIETTDIHGRTALIRAACMCPIVDMPDTDDAVRLLLDRGANIEARDNQGRRALMAAATWGRAWILQILLDKGAQIEAKDNRGDTALLISAQGSALPSANAVHVLLARGADIAARNDKGETALIVAASSRNGFEDTKVVKMLLRRGSDVHAKDKKGHTALDAAIGGRTEIVALLRTAAKSR